MTSEATRTPFSRVFLIEDGASPNHAPEYMGLARAGGLDFGQGGITPIYKPSPSQYDKFDIIDKIRGEADLPVITIENYMQTTISDMLRIVNKGCEVDLHIHFGQCEDPSNFDLGWQLERILEAALPNNFSTDDMGALGPDANAVVTETIPFAGERVYDVKKLRPSELAAAALTDVVKKVLICDSKTCGSCGISSDGCQVAFALTGANTGSPGLPAELLYTQDGGSTWLTTNITSLAASEDADDMACVGTNLVVVSAESNSLHMASIADILTGSETWTEVTTGFVALKLPRRIFSLDATHTWIVAEGGYIYFTDDPSSGVVVQHDGSLSTQNLFGVHAYDRNNIVAVGGSNVVLFSSNGGDSWTLVTGPAVGVQLNTVWMRSDAIWMVGTNGGELWYTIDFGANWTQKSFSGSGTGAVQDIRFSTRNVGYMAHDTATAGRVLRTTNGGFSWLTMPEEAAFATPVVDSILSVAACEEDANVMFAGGLHSNGSDGYLAKYA